MKNKSAVLKLWLGKMKALAMFLLLFMVNASYAQRNIVYHSLEVSYIGLNALDIITTQKLLKSGGYEMNPVMRSYPIPIKIVGTAAFLGVMRLIKKDNPKTALATLIVANIGMGYVVNRNYQIYLRIRI